MTLVPNCTEHGLPNCPNCPNCTEPLGSSESDLTALLGALTTASFQATNAAHQMELMGEDDRCAKILRAVAVIDEQFRWADSQHRPREFIACWKCKRTGDSGESEPKAEDIANIIVAEGLKQDDSIIRWVRRASP